MTTNTLLLALGILFGALSIGNCNKCYVCSDPNCGPLSNDDKANIDNCEFGCVKLKFDAGNGVTYKRMCGDAPYDVRCMWTHEIVDQRVVSEICYCNDDYCNSATFLSSTVLMTASSLIITLMRVL
ncbi:unnamed protein product [Owenia fusiformis]|uniref:Protein quiver n=1 Tax=Owenia fusiformis TaxID=6347 RepID=A0A8S4PPB5_OWEFU|nr:unnamed protein product [Owenia fusiformis]